MLPLPAVRETSLGVGAPVYVRHSPECTLLYQLVREYYPAFKARLAVQASELPAPRFIRVLERIVAWRGYPSKLRMDNGPEFISLALAEWAENHNIDFEFIKPGKSTQNSYVERFHQTCRDEVLNMYVFRTLAEVREITETWARQYNEEHPPDSLDDVTPLEYLRTGNPLENSNCACN